MDVDILACLLVLFELRIALNGLEKVASDFEGKLTEGLN